MSLDLSSYLPPAPPRHTGDEATSGRLMVSREFRKYKAEGRGIEKDEDGEYFKHQRIVRQYMVYNDRLLLFHDAGTGKTRTALGFINEIVTGSLRRIFRKVIISGPSETLKRPWLDNPEVKNLGVDVTYKTHYELSTMTPSEAESSIIILDEAHMLTSSKLISLDFDRGEDHRNSGNRTNISDKYLGVWNVIQKSLFCKVLVLTATPMQNTVFEFYPLMNLVLPLSEQITQRDLPEDRLMELMIGRVSYVGRADEGLDIEYAMDEDLVMKLVRFMFANGVQNDVIYIDENGTGEVEFYSPRGDFVKMEFEDQTYMIYHLGDNIENTSKYSPDDVEYSDGKYKLKGDLEDVYVGISIPTFLPESLKLSLEAPIVESFMSPAQSLILRNMSRTETVGDDVEDVEEKKVSGVLELRGDVIAITDHSPLNNLPHSMYTSSSIYFTAMCIMVASLPEGLVLQDPWKSMDKFEQGKNIFFSEMVDSNRGGIEKFANMLRSLGYERLPSDPTSNLGPSPRFMINPSPGQISFFNQKENSDGSRCHICLYSEKISVGVSFKDVRHIHIIPSWSPSTNTQAMFRGIRAGGDSELISKIGVFKKRVYRHVSAMSPAYSTRYDWWTEFLKEDNIYYTLDSFSSCVMYDREELKYTVMEDDKKVTDTFIGRGFRNIPDPVLYPGFHKHVGGTLVKTGPYENSFINTTAYRLSRSIEKDILLARVRRLYRVAAMDCDLNYNRNVLPPVYDSTELCDYQECSYVCLPGSRGLEIMIDTADPETGDDIRWDRDEWVPVSSYANSTNEYYSTTSAGTRKMIMDNITGLFSKSHQGFMGYWNLMTTLHGLHPEISEGMIMEIILEMLFGGHIISDVLGNRCTIRNQGDILYLKPVYEIEKLQKIETEGSVIHTFLNPPQIEVSSGILSLEDIIQPPPSKSALVAIYRGIPSDSPVNYVYSRPFEASVRVIEGAYLSYVKTGIENPISREFGKYFFKTSAGDIEKIFDRQRQLIRPSYPAWSGNEGSKTIHFHFLYHMHPSVVARKTISESSPVKYTFEADDAGFGWGTDAEQKTLYDMAIKMTNENIKIIKRRSADIIKGKYSVIGLIDNKKKFEDVNSLQYFKILREEVGKEAAKEAQGQVCMTMDANKIKKDILQSFNVNVSETRKEVLCQTVLDQLSSNNLLY